MWKMTCCALLSISATMLCGCQRQPPQRFHEGDVVEMKLDSRKGMVIFESCDWRNAPNCTYQVRFSGSQVFTDTHVISPDGSLKTQPYAIVTVEDYELK